MARACKWPLGLGLLAGVMGWCSVRRSGRLRALCNAVLPQTLDGQAVVAWKRTRLAMLVAVAVGLGLFAWFGPTGVRQARWMAESREVLPTVQGRLGSDQRFAALTAFVSTGCNIVVCGNVNSEQDKQDLQAVLGDVVFPHGVRFVVSVE